MRHIISILMENESGALSRVAGLFSARGYNIESLTVAATEDPSLSRMTLVTRGSDRVIEQITKQLNKLIDVVKLVDLTQGPHIEGELLMVKINVDEKGRDRFEQHITAYQGRVVDTTESNMTIEVTGNSEKLDKFIKAVGENNILELVRSGVAGIGRGDRI
ncbi:MAG: acetolactate synthase small subunit, partial [Acidiferrobacterales bacterium]